MEINTPSNTKTVILNIVSNEMIELKNAVNEAKIKLGLSNSELSKLIGYSRNYISETLRIGASTEKQAEITGKIKEAVAVELVSRGVMNPKCSIDMSCSQDQSAMTDFVSKAYYDQEVNKLKKEIDAERALRVFNQNEEIEEQTQNVRMLNMEVAQLEQANKILGNDLAIANRDKNFMKKKLQDKNLAINWLVVSVVFILFLLTVKCAGWV